MAKKSEKGQMDLIDYQPKNAKEIVEQARIYKKYLNQRINALEKEKGQKKLVLDMIRKSELLPQKNGIIKFQFDGFVISVTPRDELVQIKEVAGKDN